MVPAISLGSASWYSGPTSITSLSRSPEQRLLGAAEDAERGLVEVDDDQVAAGLVGLEEGHADQ